MLRQTMRLKKEMTRKNLSVYIILQVLGSVIGSTLTMSCGNLVDGVETMPISDVIIMKGSFEALRVQTLRHLQMLLTDLRSARHENKQFFLCLVSLGGFQSPNEFHLHVHRSACPIFSRQPDDS